MIVEILLNIVMSNAFLDFFFKFFEYLKWISKIQNEIFHFLFLEFIAHLAISLTLTEFWPTGELEKGGLSKLMKFGEIQYSF